MIKCLFFILLALTQAAKCMDREFSLSPTAKRYHQTDQALPSFNDLLDLWNLIDQEKNQTAQEGAPDVAPSVNDSQKQQPVTSLTRDELAALLATPIQQPAPESDTNLYGEIQDAPLQISHNQQATTSRESEQPERPVTFEEVMQRPIKCPYCSLEAPSQRLADHIKSYHASKNKQQHGDILHHHYCPLCSYQAKSLYELQRHHVEPVHLNIKHYVCQGCGKRFSLNYQLKKHKPRCPNAL